MHASVKLTNGLLVFQRYRLKRLLGRGGMGVVWLAHDIELEKDIALKFLTENLLFDSTAIRDLKKETRRGMELSHPSIIRVYGFFSEENAAAVAMEYVEGNNLSTLRDSRPDSFFEVSEIASWTMELCSALHYAHSHAEIVHRDLKPANLMIDHKSRLKVADFGISASLTEAHTRITGAVGMRGTMLYMGPQQLMGQRPCISHDIYSLGATLYDLLTGKPVFSSGDISLQVRETRPPSMAQRRKELGVEGEEIPLAWEETIAACLEKDASARPRTAAEVINRLCLETGDLGSGTPFPFVSRSDADGPLSEPTINDGAPPLSIMDPAAQAPVKASAPTERSTITVSAQAGHGKPLFSNLTLVLLLVLCCAMAGGAVAFFAFHHGRADANSQAISQSVPDKPTTNSGTASTADFSQPPATPPNTSEVHADTPSADYRREMPLGQTGSRPRQYAPRPGEPGYGPVGGSHPAGVSDGVEDRAPNKILDQPKSGCDFKLPDTSIVFRWAPPHSLRIGAPLHSPFRDTDVNTMVNFTKGFWICSSETTQQEYERFSDANPSEFKKLEAPVENVSWFDAVAFCQRLNEHYADIIPTGYIFSLPSQAQFEYASLGGMNGFYGRSGGVEDFAWSAEKGIDRPQAVKQLKANPFELHDMVGNVSEWCFDWYGPYAGGEADDMLGQEEGSERVHRGGSYLDNESQLPAHMRFKADPTTKSPSIGFRVALVPLNSQNALEY